MCSVIFDHSVRKQKVFGGFLLTKCSTGLCHSFIIKLICGKVNELLFLTYVSLIFLPKLGR